MMCSRSSKQRLYRGGDKSWVGGVHWAKTEEQPGTLPVTGAWSDGEPGGEPLRRTATPQHVYSYPVSVYTSHEGGTALFIFQRALIRP